MRRVTGRVAIQIMRSIRPRNPPSPPWVRPEDCTHIGRYLSLRNLTAAFLNPGEVEHCVNRLSSLAGLDHGGCKFETLVAVDIHVDSTWTPVDLVDSYPAEVSPSHDIGKVLFVDSDEKSWLNQQALALHPK